MAKSYLVSEPTGAPRYSRWVRQTAAGMVLVASFISLALIVKNQHSVRLAAWLTAAESAWMSGAAEPVPQVADTAEVRVEAAKHQALGEFLARRYKVSQDVLTGFVGTAYAAAREVGLDPLVVLAVMAIESRFNPIAESVAGAKGLMQVIPHYHQDKLAHWGGEKAIFDPEANIVVGTRILKEYLVRTRDLSEALQMYAGAADDPANIYAGKVLNEHQRLRQALQQHYERSLQASQAGAARPGRGG